MSNLPELRLDFLHTFDELRCLFLCLGFAGGSSILISKSSALAVDLYELGLDKPGRCSGFGWTFGGPMILDFVWPSAWPRAGW